MCGIVSWFSKEGISKDDILLAGVNTQKRGTDGAGFWTLEKGLIKTTNFIEDFDRIQKFLPDLSRLGVLHMRKKTNGNTALKNTHPFVYKNWVMVHNGIVSEHYSWYKNKINDWINEKTKGETDSEQLFMAIMYFLHKTMNIKEAINKALEIFDGSYSVVLLDLLTKQGFVFSNYDRFVFEKDNNFWFFSEQEIAEASLDISNAKKIKIEDNNLYLFDLEKNEIKNLGNMPNGERLSYYGFYYGRRQKNLFEANYITHANSKKEK